MNDEPRFVTEFYFGRVSVDHYDQHRTAEIGQIIAKALADAGVKATGVKCAWMHRFDNGAEAVDSLWDGKKWITPRPKNNSKGG
jgi:hypothetical protein